MLIVASRRKQESVKDFLSFMPSPAPLAELPEVKTVTPWDGQDGKARMLPGCCAA